MAFEKPKIFYNNRLRDAQNGNDGTSYASCAEAIADPDDPNKVRGDIVAAPDVSALADLKGSGIVFDTTKNEYRITDYSAMLQRVSRGLGLPEERSLSAALLVGSYLYVANEVGPAVIIKIDLTKFQEVDRIILEPGENLVYAMCVDPLQEYFYVSCYTSPSIIVKIGLTNFKRVAALTLNTGENSVRALSTDGTYVFAVTVTSPAIFVKINASTMVRIGAFALATGENNAQDMLYYGGSCIVSCAVTPAKLVKVDPYAMATITTLTLNAGEGPGSGLGVFGSDMFVVCHAVAARVVKFNPVAMTRTSVLTFNAGENYGYKLCFDATYGYICTDQTSPAMVLKFNPTAMTRTGALTLNSQEDQSQGIALYGGKIYPICRSTPGYVVKVDPGGSGSPTRDGVLTLTSGITTVMATVIHDNALFVGDNGYPIAQVAKFSLPDMTLISILALNSGESNIRSMHSYGSYIFAGMGTTPAKIVKIDPVGNMTRIGVVTFNSGENSCEGMCTFGAKIYAACPVTPSIIVEFDPDTMTRSRALTLSAGENSVNALEVYSNNIFALTYTVPASVIKIDPVTMTRVSAQALSTNEDNGKHLRLHTDKLYIACETSPGRIVRFNPATMTREDGMALDTGENLPQWMVFCQGILFVVCYLSPARIVAVNPTTLVKKGGLSLNSGENAPYDIHEYNNSLFSSVDIGPTVAIVKISPLESFSLFERLQDADIGDSFTVCAGLQGMNEDPARPTVYAADGHLTPRAKGLTNTILKLRAHAPNFIEDGGFESGAFSPNWTAGANWSVLTANGYFFYPFSPSDILEGASSAAWDCIASNHLQQTVTKKIEQGKTYHILFKAKSITANPIAGAITVQAKQIGSNADLMAAMTGTTPAITTTAAWFEIDLTPDFTTGNWYFKLLADSTKANGATGVIIDEVYVYEKKTINSLIVDKHNWAGKTGIIVNAWRLSPLRSTAASDAANKSELANFNVDTADTILQTLTSSTWPVYELVIPAVSGWTMEAGEIFIGSGWQVPRYAGSPLDPRGKNADGLRKAKLTFKNLDPLYRLAQIQELFDSVGDNEAVWFQWDTDAPVLMEDKRRDRDAPYAPRLVNFDLDLVERL